MGQQGECAVAITARIAPGAAIAAALIEDIGITITVEVADHHARTAGNRGKCRVGRDDEGPCVVTQIATLGTIDPHQKIHVPIAIEVGDEVVGVVMIRQR